MTAQNDSDGAGRGSDSAPAGARGRRPTDMMLFERWQEGDGSSGQRLLRRHFDSIHRFFASKIDRDVEELVQNTFLACVKSRDRFQKKSSFRTYLFAIARRQLFRHFRDYYGKGRDIDFGVTSIADLDTGLGTKLVHSEERALLARALSTLPVNQQLLLELYYWEEMNTGQLAEVFEVSPSTVSTWLFRARAALRQDMQRQAQASRPADESIEGFDTWARGLENRAELRQHSEVAARLRANRSG